MKIFIDSSAFISLLVSDQITHKQAASVFSGFRESHTFLYTSNYVLTECYTWMIYRDGLHIAKGLKAMVDVAEKQGYLDVFWVDDLISEEAWPYFVKFSEHKLSYTDVTSYLLVKKFRLDGIFTFDEGFKKVGLPVKP